MLKTGLPRRKQCVCPFAARRVKFDTFGTTLCGSESQRTRSVAEPHIARAVASAVSLPSKNCPHRKSNLDAENVRDCVHSAEFYPFWQRELSRIDMQHRAFGENLTVAGITELDVCIGDTWATGDVFAQVSQSRQPCWKLARSWNIKDLALRVQQTGYTGWHFRLLREGYIANGMPITLVDRPFSEWTVDKANHIMHHDKQNFTAAVRLASIPLLSTNLQETQL